MAAIPDCEKEITLGQVFCSLSCGHWNYVPIVKRNHNIHEVIGNIFLFWCLSGSFHHAYGSRYIQVCLYFVFLYDLIDKIVRNTKKCF